MSFSDEFYHNVELAVPVGRTFTGYDLERLQTKVCDTIETYSKPQFPNIEIRIEGVNAIGGIIFDVFADKSKGDTGHARVQISLIAERLQHYRVTGLEQMPAPTSM